MSTTTIHRWLVDAPRLALRRQLRALRRASLSDGAPRLPGRFLSGRHVDRRGLRDYRLYVPLSHTACIAHDDGATATCRVAPLPLVVMLHGCTQTAEDFARGTRMNEAAEAGGFLALYPEQSARANPGRCWNWFHPSERRRDTGEAGLLAALVRDVMARYPVDPARVYVAGLSAGGAMAAALGAAYPDLFAAVGVHSGPVPSQAQDVASAIATMRHGPGDDDEAGPPMPPLIVFHGDRDEVVHPRNGVRLAGADTEASMGGGLARFAASTRSWTRRRRVDAAGRVVAEHWSVHGAGHAWSGGSARGTYTDPSGPSATAAMLRFFFERRLAEARTPGAVLAARPRAFRPGWVSRGWARVSAAARS